MKRAASITAFPEARLWPKGGAGSGWLRSFASMHESGRAALYWALGGLALPPGTTAWMPSFHCGVEVDAAIAAGFEVRFYRVGLNLAVDEGDLRSRLALHPGPVLAIHYFGFPQPGLDRLGRLCREYGCTLIEDCAHALFSRDEAGRELGSHSPLAIYSLRKTLPVVDGGALRAVGVPAALPKLSRSAAGAYRVYLKTAARRMIGEGLTSLYRSMRWRNDSAPDPEERHAARTGAASYRKPMSRISQMVAAATEPSQVVRIRRENFLTLNYMLKGLPEYRPVWDKLPAGTCPLFLPVRVENRAELMARMATGGIETFRFGASSPHRLDPNDFPEAAALREGILCLPVHQDLGANDIGLIARTFREAVKTVYAPQTVATS